MVAKPRTTGTDPWPSLRTMGNSRPQQIHSLRTTANSWRFFGGTDDGPRMLLDPSPLQRYFTFTVKVTLTVLAL